MKQFDPVTLASLFKDACFAEITALKPGNVHIFSDGHGMVVQDFIKSAEVSAPAISQQGISVGQRILNAVNATQAAVGCNTNLGILLLATPLIQAAEMAGEDFQAKLIHVLHNLTVEDAVLAYQAIQIASPAGLGSSEQYDVADVPKTTLLNAMHAAKDRDFIAQQYANGYAHIFNFGLPKYFDLLKIWDRPAWAVTGLYIVYLAEFLDTHIIRKYGQKVAEQVRVDAKSHLAKLMTLDNPKLYQKELLEFDQSLKKMGINPGTSADLTVATILAFQLARY